MLSCLQFAVGSLVALVMWGLGLHKKPDLQEGTVSPSQLLPRRATARGQAGFPSMSHLSIEPGILPKPDCTSQSSGQQVFDPCSMLP